MQIQNHAASRRRLDDLIPIAFADTNSCPSAQRRTLKCFDHGASQVSGTRVPDAMDDQDIEIAFGDYRWMLRGCHAKNAVTRCNRISSPHISPGCFFRAPLASIPIFMPYRGAGLTMQHLLAEQIDPFIRRVAKALPQLRAGIGHPSNDRPISGSLRRTI